MICSHLVNMSLLAGAVLSYGVMWPLIEDRKGAWFPSSLPQSSMKSLNGYKVRLFQGQAIEFPTDQDSYDNLKHWCRFSYQLRLS